LYEFRNAIGSRVEYRPTGATGTVLAQESLSWCIRVQWDEGTDAPDGSEWIRDADVFPTS